MSEYASIRYPVVSLGVLRWVEHTLSDLTFFEEAAEASSLFLALLNEVCVHCSVLSH